MTYRDQPNDSLADALQRDLLQRYGPVIGQDDLRQALGYASPGGFRQALARGVIPVPVFAIPHRRGKYALTKDVASWLAELRRQASPTAAA
ncbi:hypothetical protein LDO31_08675 [Luteimonas sp. XNQY3]|nr:hypothetical protein [Luteimonas sp. XNQY3]